MKDNYSWLDQSLRAIIDHKDPEVAISEVANQIEIEKLRARIETVNTILLFDSDKAHTAKEILQAENDYITKLLSDLTEKLKELER